MGEGWKKGSGGMVEGVGLRKGENLMRHYFGLPMRVSTPSYSPLPLKISLKTLKRVPILSLILEIKIIFVGISLELPHLSTAGHWGVSRG